MNYSKYRFNLDMQSYISQVSLPVRQHDTGIILRINITDGGVPYVIRDGCRAVFYARKSDGNPLMNDCIIEKNTTICYELTQQTTACSGVVDCEVRLYGSDGNLITTPRFILVIDSRVVHDEDFPLSDAEQTVLDNIILSEQARIKAEEERVKSSAEALAKAEQAEELVDELIERLAVEDIGDEELRMHNENPEAHKAMLGEGNVRGLKGYWVLSVIPSQNYLRLTTKTDRSSVGKPTILGSVPPNWSINTGYEVGDEFSIITPKNHYNLCGKITAIQNDLIYYELYTEIDWNAGDPKDNNDYAFFVPAKADVGIVDVAKGGFPTGYGTRAGGDYSTSSGALTNAYDSYGDAGGLRSKSGYCAFTRGSDNDADAKYSAIPGGIDNKVGVNGLQGFIGGGNGNEVNGYSGSARNGRNKVYADYGDGSGFENTIEKGANASSISGQYNTIKEGAHSVFGGGYNNTVYGTGFAGLISGIVNWLKSKAGYVGGENCHSGEAWYQFLHGQGLRAGNKLAQALFGRFNKVNDDAVFQVGNGVLDEARSNAFEIISTRDENGTNHVSMVLGDEVFSPSSIAEIVSGNASGVDENGLTTIYFDTVPTLLFWNAFTESLSEYKLTMVVDNVAVDDHSITFFNDKNRNVSYVGLVKHSALRKSLYVICKGINGAEAEYIPARRRVYAETTWASLVNAKLEETLYHNLTWFYSYNEKICCQVQQIFSGETGGYYSYLKDADGNYVYVNDIVKKGTYTVDGNEKFYFSRF